MHVQVELAKSVALRAQVAARFPVVMGKIWNMCDIFFITTGKRNDMSPTKVPEPVRVLCEPSLASAEASPPALTVFGTTAKLTLMRSHRTYAAWPKATETVTIIDNSTTVSPAIPLLVICIHVSFRVKYATTRVELPEKLQELWEERAAIMAADGHLPRAEAARWAEAYRLP